MAELYVVTVPDPISEEDIDNILKDDPILTFLLPEYDLRKIRTRRPTQTADESHVMHTYGILDIFCQDHTKSELGGRLEERLGIPFTVTVLSIDYFVESEPPNDPHTSGWVSYFDAKGLEHFPIPHVIVRDIIAKDSLPYSPFRFFMDFMPLYSRYSQPDLL